MRTLSLHFTLKVVDSEDPPDQPQVTHTAVIDVIAVSDLTSSPERTAAAIGELRTAMETWSWKQGTTIGGPELQVRYFIKMGDEAEREAARNQHRAMPRIVPEFWEAVSSAGVMALLSTHGFVPDTHLGH